VKRGEGNTNSPELSLLKFLPLTYHQAISWPPPWISHHKNKLDISHENFKN